MRVDSSHSTSIFGWFSRRVHFSPEAPCISFGADVLNYQQLLLRVEHAAELFLAGGLKPGQRLCYLGQNDLVAVIALLAAAKIGATFVPLNYRLSAVELLAVLDDCAPHTLLLQRELETSLHSKALAQRCHRWMWVEELIQRAPASTREHFDAVHDHERLSKRSNAAVLMYTSGTSGTPKGVLLTHDNIWAAILNNLLTLDFKSTDRTLITVPLFHAAGLFSLLLPTLAAGGHAVLQRGFDPDLYLQSIERDSITVTLAVPTMLQRLLESPRFSATALSSLRIVISGGAPVPESLLRRLEEFGVAVCQCYGMTESTSIISALRADHALTKIGSCGRAAPLMDVRLVDSAGKVVTSDFIRAEIWIRGASVTLGYWERPTETAAASTNGWFRTGDVAYRDQDGFLFICDRLKDMIISGGENIYPAELEAVLARHDSIREIAIIGEPDAKWGEHVLAVVVPNGNMRLSLEELRDFAARQLARYKLPSRVIYVSELPRNAAGKILRAKLREKYVAQ